jgi:homoserine O-succinyltransferase/O-acetyltransferase
LPTSIRRWQREWPAAPGRDAEVPLRAPAVIEPAAGPASNALLRRGGRCKPLVIGLVNNMPDAALHNTERQFRQLISTAGGDVPIRLRLFYLPEIPRRDRGRSYVEEHYEAADALWANRLDGLIVTGNEPRAADLRDEPYWGALTRLVDWAERRTISTVWSCLAAHAAVLYTDGIARQALPGKLSGVFECDKIADHAIIRGAPPRWRVAHSRCNGVSEAALTSHGYRLLSRSEAAGPDLFIRQNENLFVYFQGHPEYDPDSLAREYRRDIGRFLTGERDEYPEMPRGYFSEAAATELALFEHCALRERSPDLLSHYPVAALGQSAGGSSAVAVGIFRRWLALLAQGKRGSADPERGVAPRQPDIAVAMPGQYG